jgi:hypothetical protein
MSALRITFILAIIAVILSGCGPNATEDDDSAALTPDTPLELQLNDKGQIRLHGRWIELYIESNKLSKHLRAQSQRYREMFQEYQINLPKYKVGGAVVEQLPIEVKIETMAGTKPSWIVFLQRTCREFGFTNFVVQRPEEVTAN